MSYIVDFVDKPFGNTQDKIQEKSILKKKEKKEVSYISLKFSDNYFMKEILFEFLCEKVNKRF